MHTLTPYIRTYIADRTALGVYGPKSRRVVMPRLTNFSASFGRRPLEQLTPRAVTRWLGELDHLATNSRAAYLASLRQFTAWLTDTGHLSSDPCQQIPRVRRPASVPRAQAPSAIGAILAACIDERETAIVWLMVGLGLRRMEVAGLRWEHYDHRDQMLLVAQAKHGNERLLPVTDEVDRALTALPDRTTTGPIIRSRADGYSPVSTEHIGRLAGAVIRRSGVKRGAYDGVSGHALRHTAASDVLDGCGDLRVVQQMLGHRDLSSTSIYLRRASADQMRAAMGGRSYPEAA